MVSEHVGNRRLLKVADFLDKLDKSKFDYSEVVSKYEGNCGTVCCALGWLPSIFKKDFSWTEVNYGWIVGFDRLEVVRKGQRRDDIFALASQYFSITEWESSLLFDPDNNNLGDDATPKQVARHIRRFVSKRIKSREKAKKK